MVNPRLPTVHYRPCSFSACKHAIGYLFDAATVMLEIPKKINLHFTTPYRNNSKFARKLRNSFNVVFYQVHRYNHSYQIWALGKTPLKQKDFALPLSASLKGSSTT